jgi:hypothetical protein
VDKKVRGSSLLGIIGYIHGGLDATARKRVLEKLPAEKGDLKHIAPNDLYSIEEHNLIVQAIASAFDTPEKRYDVFIGCGGQIAADAINSFLRLLIKFLKPSLFARKYGDFFRRAHTFGSVEAKDIGPHSFVLEMSGVEGYDYVAPLTLGFVLHTLGAMGCENIVAKEVTTPPSAPQDRASYVMQVTWS